MEVSPHDLPAGSLPPTTRRLAASTSTENRTRQALLLEPNATRTAVHATAITLVSPEKSLHRDTRSHRVKPRLLKANRGTLTLTQDLATSHPRQAADTPYPRGMNPRHWSGSSRVTPSWATSPQDEYPSPPSPDPRQLPQRHTHACRRGHPPNGSVSPRKQDGDQGSGIRHQELGVGGEGLTHLLVRDAIFGPSPLPESRTSLDEGRLVAGVV